MKKDDLVKIIRAIVKQEIKKELPNALAQVFQNLMGGRTPTDTLSTGGKTPTPPSPVENPATPPEDTDEIDEAATLKTQLREMLNGGGPIQRAQPRQTQQPPKRFTNNPVLNEVLNQTRPFNSSERMAMRAGGAGLASPGVMIAAAGFNSPEPSITGAGEMMPDNDLAFTKNIPTMPGADAPVISELPVGHASSIQEGQEGGPAPLESMGSVSALDIRNHPALPKSIKDILNRDYRSLVRAMDKKK